MLMLMSWLWVRVQGKEKIKRHRYWEHHDTGRFKAVRSDEIREKNFENWAVGYSNLREGMRSWWIHQEREREEANEVNRNQEESHRRQIKCFTKDRVTVSNVLKLNLNQSWEFYIDLARWKTLVTWTRQLWVGGVTEKGRKPTQSEWKRKLQMRN